MSKKEAIEIMVTMLHYRIMITNILCVLFNRKVIKIKMQILFYIAE